MKKQKTPPQRKVLRASLEESFVEVVRLIQQARQWELERQLAGALFERAVLNPSKVSAVLTQLHPAAENVFKDTYLLDFRPTSPHAAFRKDQGRE